MYYTIILILLYSCSIVFRLFCFRKLFSFVVKLQKANKTNERPSLKELSLSFVICT